MNDEVLPILIATDRAEDAELIARTLGEEFAGVQISTDASRCLPDFELFKPALLVLAFNTVEKAKRHLHKLRQPSVMVKTLPYRVIVLCSQEGMSEVYELCKKEHFDDFVLFWPRSAEMRPLHMVVRRALREVTVMRCSEPSVRDFAARSRRLGALETLLEERGAKPEAGNGTAAVGAAPLLDTVRALRQLAERCTPLVLVVDDDRLQHKLLSHVLGSEKVELAFATTAAEAIASLHKRRPDLILMDVSMPEVDGIEATRLLKSAAQFSAIAVIMITGVGGPNVVVDSLKAGAADFVVKPFDRNILLAKVRKLIFGRTSAA